MKIFLLCFFWLVVISTVYAQSDTVVVAPPGSVATVPGTDTEVVPEAGVNEVVPGETAAVPVIDEGGGETGDYDQGIPVITDEVDNNNNRDNVIWDRSLRSTVEGKPEAGNKNETHHVVVVMPGLPGLPGLPGNPGQATLQSRRTGTIDFNNCRFNVSGNGIFLCNYTDDGYRTNGSMNKVTDHPVYDGMTGRPIYDRRTDDHMDESTGSLPVSYRKDRPETGHRSDEPIMEGSRVHSVVKQLNEFNNSDIDPGFNPFASNNHHHQHHYSFGPFNITRNNRSSPAVEVIYRVIPEHRFPNGHDNGRRPISFHRSTTVPVSPLTESNIGYEPDNVIPTEPSVRGPAQPESRQLHFEAIELEVDNDRNQFPDFPRITLPPINLPPVNIPPFPPISFPGSSNPGVVVAGQPGMPGKPGMPGSPGTTVISSSTSDLAIDAPFRQRAPVVVPNAIRPAAVPVVQTPGVLPVGGGIGQYPISPYGEIPGVSSSSYLGRPGSAISSQASVSGTGGQYGYGVPGIGYPGYPGYPVGTGVGVSPIVGQPGYPAYPGLYPGYGGIGGGQYPYYPGGVGGIGGLGGGYPIAG